MKTLLTISCALFVLAACNDEPKIPQTPIQSPVFSCAPAVEPALVSTPTKPKSRTITYANNCAFPDEPLKPEVVFISEVTTVQTDYTYKPAIQHGVAAQTFTVDPTRDTLITGSGGSMVLIKAGSLTFADGTVPTGPVEIDVKECLTPIDAVLENLSTKSNGQLLGSRGMLKITAMANNRELKLKPGSTTTLFFPKPENESEPVALFYGDTVNGNLNWRLDRGTTRANWQEYLRVSRVGYRCTFVGNDSVRMDLGSYFRRYFDFTQLENSNKYIGREIVTVITTDRHGNTTDVKAYHRRYRSTYLSKRNAVNDPYISEFVNSFYFNDCKGFRKGHNNLRARFLRKQPTRYTVAMRVRIRQTDPAVYQKEFEKKFESNGSSSKTVSNIELDYYIASASELGWINCDFFWQTDAPRTNFAVNVNPSSEPHVMMIFPRINCTLAGELIGNRYIFKNIPLGEPIRIVAMKQERGNALVAVNETRVSRDSYAPTDYETFNIESLRAKLNLTETALNSSSENTMSLR